MTVTHVCKLNNAFTSVRIVRLQPHSNWEIRSTLDGNYAKENDYFDALEINFCPFCGIKLVDLIKKVSLPKKRKIVGVISINEIFEQVALKAFLDSYAENKQKWFNQLVNFSEISFAINDKLEKEGYNLTGLGSYTYSGISLDKLARRILITFGFTKFDDLTGKILINISLEKLLEEEI